MAKLDKLLSGKVVDSSEVLTEEMISGLARATRLTAQVLGSRKTKWSGLARQQIKDAHEELLRICRSLGINYREGGPQ